jgi:rhodanese-related sulfurtransferase
VIPPFVRILRTLFLVCCFTAQAGQAELVSGKDLPKGLEDAMPAGSLCGKSEVDAKRRPAQRDAGKARGDLGCAIDADKLAALLASPDDLILADLRPSAAFAVYRIATALNVDISMLLNKPYWHEKTLVLMGDGKAERERYLDCARLKRNGYTRVHVLRGGIAQWLALGFSIQGHVPSSASQLSLSATEFWQEARNPQNLVLLNGSLTQLAKSFPEAKHINTASPEAVAKALTARRRESGPERVSAIVLATDGGFNEAQVASLIQTSRPVPLLFYVGNAEEFQRQLTMQDAIWKAHDHGPKVPQCGR